MTRSSPAVEHRLEQRRQIHRAAGGGAGADGRVHFVDEEDRLRRAGERGDDGLEALLEVAAEPRAGEQRARVEREDLGAAQRLGHVVLEQPRREALGHRRLADAGLADEHRVVLAAAAEHLDRALQFLRAGRSADRGRRPRPLGEVDRVGRQRIARRCRRPSSSSPRGCGAARGAVVVAATGTFAIPCEM